MKSILFTGLVFFSVLAEAQNIYIGATTRGSRRNEHCSFKATYPNMAAAPNAPEVVKNLVSTMNAKYWSALNKVESDYRTAVASSQWCSGPMRAYEKRIQVRATAPLGANVMSLYVVDYTHSGGAHGSSEASAETFNANTGDVYSHIGAFVNQAKLGELKQVIQGALGQSIHGEGGFETWAEKISHVNQIKNFYVGEVGLVFYFQEYEVGPYSAGVIKVEVSHYHLDPLLNGSAAAKALLSNWRL